MSTNQSNNKNSHQEPIFDEYRAYEELRMIFVIAIETQDFTTLEERISAWERRYPLAEFTDEDIIRKIKTILNKDFLSRLIGDYLAARILHEQEKQKEFYDSLKTIIDNAKKSKDYKTAKKEIRKWKDNLYENGYSLCSFNRIYRAKICTLLLLPSKEIENQEKATDELKTLKETGNALNSEDYFAAISNWQNKYSISDFPEKLQKELNVITTEIFDSISQKRTSENAIAEIEGILTSKDVSLPANAITTILSKYDYSHFDADTTAHIRALTMQALSVQESILNEGFPDIDLSILPSISPIEAQALNSLKDILNKTPHDMDIILNWIYINRKINYSEFARETIIKQFSSVGYIIPEQSSYSIPVINSNLKYTDSSKIDDIRKDVILNYLGLISQGNKLSIESKDKLIEAHAISAEEALSQKGSKPTMFLEAFDTIMEQPKVETETLYNEADEIDVDKNEEAIYNIFIEDIIDDPLTTYTIPTSSKNNKSAASDLEQNSIEESTEIDHNIDEQPIAEAIPTTDEPSVTEVVPTVDKQTIAEVHSSLEEKAPSSDTNSENLLTTQDEDNLEKAYDLSTYIVVVSPILAQTLAPKLERSRKRVKDAERIK